MKIRKSLNIIFLVLALLTILATSFISAETTPKPQDALGIDLNSDLSSNLNPEKLAEISEDPTAIANASSNYLKRELGKIIDKRLPFLSKLHHFLLEHQLIFKILLKKEYGINLAFFIVLAFWVFSSSFLGSLYNEIFSEKVKYGLVLGILSSSLIAWTSLFNWVSNSLINIALSPETWWMRMILWAILIILFIILVYFKEDLIETIDSMRKDKKKQELEEEVEELRAESEGKEEGREMTQPLRDMKKKEQLDPRI